MKHGSLFSGIGGFDLAADWMGWENVFHCEWNPFGQKILKHYWPDAKSYGDITKTDFTEWRGKVDIVSGGFPCQPYSTAGKRKGKADDRHLWPEMLRAIREIQPRWVVGENVPGLLNWQRGMVLDEIKADLEAAGFEVFPSLVLPACGKDAGHKRERVWIVSYNYRSRFNRNGKEINSNKRELDALCWPDSIFTTDNNSIGIQREFSEKIYRPKRIKGRQIEQQLTDSFRRSDTFEPKLCRTLYGVPNGVDRIKALGNAIVPQIAYEIFKAIETVDKL